MADVRSYSGVPSVSAFDTQAGFVGQICAPIVLNSVTGIAYTLVAGVVTAIGGGSGTVTSVAETFTGGLISVAGSPVTTSGTLALTVAGTSGGIPYFSSATTWASSAVLTASRLVLGGGAASAPTVLGSLGTTTTLLHGNAAGVPSFSAVVEADVTLADVTTLNVTSTAHGLAPKSPADATQFLNGAATSAWAQVKDSDLSTTDITTNNVSTSKHGFTPKLPNDATKYLDGTGAYTVPAGGTSGRTTIGSGLLSGASVTVSSITSGYAYIEVQVIGYSFDTNARRLRIQPNADTTTANYAYTNTASGTILTAPSLGLGTNDTITLSPDTGTATCTIRNYQGTVPHFTTFNYNKSETSGTPLGLIYDGYYANGAITSIKLLLDNTGNFASGTYAVYGYN